MKLQVVLIAALASFATAFEDNELYGISHMGMTVKNLDLSTRYYQEVLGAMLIEGLSTGNEGVYGESHYYRMFQKEILESQDVPDIRDSGTHEVRWNFLLLSNVLIQLIEFRDRRSGQVYFNEDKKVGNAFIGSNHGCLTANLDVIPLQQMENIIERQAQISDMDADKKDFIAYFGPEPGNFAERNARPLNTKLLPFAPNFMLSSTRGPAGEKWEIGYRRGDGLFEDFRPFCEHKGVYPIMLDTQLENGYQQHLSQQMGGLNHINVVVEDIDKTVRFYTTVLGGKLNSEKSQSAFPIPKPFYDLIHQDEILEAKKQGEPANLNFGILPGIFEGPGNPLVAVYFIAFDNMYLEPYRYYINDSYRQVPSNLYRSWSGPSYINIMHTGFWVKEDVNMATFIKNMEDKSERYGLNKVKANRAVAVTRLGQRVNDNQYSAPFPENHRLAGFDYTFFKGPSGEQNVLVQFKGKAKQILQAAMEQYGALSTAFPSTNPWNWAGFNRTCEWVKGDERDDSDRYPVSSATRIAMFLPFVFALLLV